MSFTTGRSANAWGLIFARLLLDAEPLEKIRGPDHFAMAQREARMGDAGVEVVGEALDHRGQLPAVGLHQVVASSRASADRLMLLALEEAFPGRPVLRLVDHGQSQQFPVLVGESEHAGQGAELSPDRGANGARRLALDGISVRRESRTGVSHELARSLDTDRFPVQ